MSEATVLCVDPDDDPGGPRARLAAESELSVVWSDSVATARQQLQETDVDCLVTEYDLPDGTGIDLVRYVRDRAQDIGCILYTAADRETVTEGLETPLVVEYLHREGPAAADRLAALVTVTAQRRTQTAYPLPVDESARLATLTGLDLDSDALAAALDRVTELAVRHFDLDRASVNIVAESTQEVLACTGPDLPSMPREESICTYSILDEGVTVVEDTASDPRFADNETLAAHDIRFYAGAPLRTDAGLPVGTLCVYDAEPRTFSDEEAGYLQLLAASAVEWFEVYGRLSGHEAAAAGGDR
jgi:DNA-binding response OmpR family regulator